MSGSNTAANGRNNSWLDLVRAMAIILVLLRHGERALGHEADLGPLQTISINGWTGVDIFFVLSGYLIASHLLRAGIGTGHFSFGRYLVMRALRIVPAYLAVIGLILFGAFPLYTIDENQLLLRVGYHLLFLQDYLPSNINVVFWSLGVEEKFYLLAPVLIFVVLRCRSTTGKATILASCFLLPVLLRFEAYARVEAPIDYTQFFRVFRSPFHMTVEGLVVGVAIAVVQASGHLRPSGSRGMVILVASTVLLLGWMSSHDFMAEIDMTDAVWQPVAIAIIAGGLTLGAVLLGGTSMPAHRPVNMLARLSYCLYLVHLPLIPTAVAIATSKGMWLFWPIYLALSLGAAVLLHVAVEKPFLLWKDRIATRQTIGAPISAA